MSLGSLPFQLQTDQESRPPEYPLRTYQMTCSLPHLSWLLILLLVQTDTQRSNQRQIHHWCDSYEILGWVNTVM